MKNKTEQSKYNLDDMELKRLVLKDGPADWLVDGILRELTNPINRIILYQKEVIGNSVVLYYGYDFDEPEFENSPKFEMLTSRIKSGLRLAHEERLIDEEFSQIFGDKNEK